MAEQLDSYEFERARREGGRYLQYLDGSIWRLVVGEDPSLNIRTYLHTLARKQGKRVQCKAESNALVVQAYDREAA